MIILTPEQGRELRSLYERLPDAAKEAMAAIATGGMESQEFRDADRRLGDIFRRIRGLQGE